MASWITKNANGIQGPFKFQDLRDKLDVFPSDTQFQLVGTISWIGISSFTVAKSEKELIPPPPPLPQQMLKDQAVPPPPPIAKLDGSIEALPKSEDANRRDFMGGGLVVLGGVLAAAFGGMKKTAKKIPDQIDDTVNRGLRGFEGYSRAMQQQEKERRLRENSAFPVLPLPHNNTPKK